MDRPIEAFISNKSFFPDSLITRVITVHIAHLQMQAPKQVNHRVDLGRGQSAEQTRLSLKCNFEHAVMQFFTAGRQSYGVTPRVPGIKLAGDPPRCFQRLQ